MMKRTLFKSVFRTPERVMNVVAVLMLACVGVCEQITAPTPLTVWALAADVVAGEARPVRVTPEGVNAAEPAVAVAPDGAVYVAWVAHGAGKEADVFVARFDGEGKRAGEPVRVNPKAGEATAWRGDPPGVAVAADGSVYVAWTARAGTTPHATTLFLSTSRDGGKSFAAPVKVNDDARECVHGMHSLALGRDGRVLVAWLDERNAGAHESMKMGEQMGAMKSSGGGHAEANRELYFAASTDGGRTFSKNRLVASEACPCCKTALAASTDGRVYVGWRQVLPGDFRHIAVAASADGGANFAAPTVVSDDRWELQGCPVSGPALAAGERGGLRVLWFTAGEAGSPGLYGAESSDGGRSFAPRRAVREGNLRGTPLLVRDGGGELLTVFEGVNESGAGSIWRAKPDGADVTPVSVGASASAAARAGRLYVAYVSTGGVWLTLSDGAAKR